MPSHALKKNVCDLKKQAFKNSRTGQYLGGKNSKRDLAGDSVILVLMKSIKIIMINIQ